MLTCLSPLFLMHIRVHYFFFIKQKTAYEMRMSDWSSDVCSSDLLDGDHMLARPRRLALLGPARAVALRRQHIADAAMAVADRQQQEIGRASCRDRVCQYV